MCCECEYVFSSATHRLTRTSCRCPTHAKSLQTWRRPRYTGDIAIHLTRPIRTGLLQSVDRGALVSFVMSIIKGADRETVAQSCVDELSHFTRSQLLDNGFWWEDSRQRKNGVRYRHKSNNKKRPRQFGHLTDEISSVTRSHTRALPSSHECPRPDNAVDHMWDDVLRATDPLDHNSQASEVL